MPIHVSMRAPQHGGVVGVHIVKFVAAEQVAGVCFAHARDR